MYRRCGPKNAKKKKKTKTLSPSCSLTERNGMTSIKTLAGGGGEEEGVGGREVGRKKGRKVGRKEEWEGGRR